METALVWVQGMPTIVKGIVSIVIPLLSVLALYLVWQDPPATPNSKLANSDSITQSGNIASAGQSGGVTAGVYIHSQPPVTEQQKAQALASLQSELEELAQFPNRPDVPAPRTMLEQFTLAKSPHQLFVLLGKYYKPTIVSVPKIGEELFQYKRAYYAYENDQLDLENRVTEKIGTLVEGRYRQAWRIYLRYSLFRFAGLNREQIEAGGAFINFGVTWEDAERVYGALSSDPDISAAMKNALATQNSVVAAATRILSSIKHQ